MMIAVTLNTVTLKIAVVYKSLLAVNISFGFAERSETPIVGL